MLQQKCFYFHVQIFSMCLCRGHVVYIHLCTFSLLIFFPFLTLCLVEMYWRKEMELSLFYNANFFWITNFCEEKSTELKKRTSRQKVGKSTHFPIYLQDKEENVIFVFITHFWRDMACSQKFFPKNKFFVPKFFCFLLSKSSLSIFTTQFALYFSYIMSLFLLPNL